MQDPGGPDGRRFAFDLLGFGPRPTPRAFIGRVAGTALGLFLVVLVHEALENAFPPPGRLALLAGVMAAVALVLWTPVDLVAVARNRASN